MRVLVTGAAGFIGSRVAMHLDGDDVHALDRAESDPARLRALASHAHFVACDLDEPGAIEDVVGRLRPDVCVHLAWYAVPGSYLDAPQNFDHVASTLRLARALQANGCKRLVTAGTCFEYDTSGGRPIAETSAVAPSFLYSACKLAVFEMLRQACCLWRMPYCHARFFYQYGPWEAPNRLVPAIVTALLRGEEARTTSGDQIRDFLHIDDVGRAVALLARTDIEGAVNVGSGIEVRVRDIVAAAAQACGRQDLLRIGALPQRPGDPPYVCADAGRLRGLGWSPRFSLEDGLAETVAWYRTRA